MRGLRICRESFWQLLAEARGSMARHQAAYAAQEAAAMEAERTAGAAADVASRLDWVTQRLAGAALEAVSCPVCHPDALSGGRCSSLGKL